MIHGQTNIKNNVCFYYTTQTLLRDLEILEGRFECERCVPQDLA
jgi:hypothetical protein